MCLTSLTSCSTAHHAHQQDPNAVIAAEGWLQQLCFHSSSQWNTLSTNCQRFKRRKYTLQMIDMMAMLPQRNRDYRRIPALMSHGVVVWQRNGCLGPDYNVLPCNNMAVRHISPSLCTARSDSISAASSRHTLHASHATANTTRMSMQLQVHPP